MRTQSSMLRPPARWTWVVALLAALPLACTAPGEPETPPSSTAPPASATPQEPTCGAELVWDLVYKRELIADPELTVRLYWAGSTACATAVAEPRTGEIQLTMLPCERRADGACRHNPSETALAKGIDVAGPAMSRVRDGCVRLAVSVDGSRNWRSTNWIDRDGEGSRECRG